MLATFCLRLAFGLIAALLLFPASIVNPRFYRTHFLTAFALTNVAIFMLRYGSGDWLWPAALALLLTFMGSVVWSLAGAPAGRTLILLSTSALAMTLVLNPARGTTQVDGTGHTPPNQLTPAERLADDFTSAAVLGTATTAMLMGHSYLIAPAMSLTPLLRLLYGLFVVLFLRIAVAAFGLWSWTSSPSAVNLTTEDYLWLPVRWLVGFALPLVLGWMTWQAAKIRSTQSATGILYVVVICCFLGELLSQLLTQNIGYTF